MSFEQMPRRDSEEETYNEEVQKADSESHEELLNETDALLDDIDDILESDAQAFMDGFVQKGGQ